MHLQPDETFGVRSVISFVSQIRDLLAVNPSLNIGPVGQNTKRIPLPVLKMFGLDQVFFFDQPTTSGFSVNIASFTAFGSAACLDLNLWSIHASEFITSLFFGRVQGLGLRANLDTRIKLV